jgi:general stress protein YciG
MDPAKQRAIASKGGSSVPPEKRPFAQNHRLAAEAGRKGGENSHGGRKPVPTPADPPEPATD